MKNGIYIAIAGVVLVLVGLFLWRFNLRSPEPAPLEIPMASGEQVAAWNFKGAYTGNSELEAKAQSEIERLTGLLDSGVYPDYVLYVSIANQYDLMGDGKKELIFLEKALALDSTNTGLAWHNAGQLFKRLGAYRTARYSFEKAVAAQALDQYQLALSDLVAAHPEAAAQ